MVYKNELDKKIEQVVKKVNTQFQFLNKKKTTDDDWFDEYKKLNLLRIDLLTAKSRRANVDRPHIRIESQIPKK